MLSFLIPSSLIYKSEDNMNSLIKSFGSSFQKLYDRMYKKALIRIQKISKNKKYEVKCIFCLDVYDCNGDKVDNTEIHKIIFAFEESFGNFGIFWLKNGEFLEGETPIVVINKPL